MYTKSPKALSSSRPYLFHISLTIQGSTSSMFASGRLTARIPSPKDLPDPPPIAVKPGSLHTLGIHHLKDTLLYVPSSYTPGQVTPLPMIVTLHGAGSTPQSGMQHLLGLADDYGVVIMSPGSRSGTWDFLRGGLGPDVATINQSLHLVFSSLPIHPAHCALSGFSDGASYALTIGLANGPPLFSHILAFSPGFMRPPFYSKDSKPRIFVSHGARDAVLRIVNCSRKVVPVLERIRYEVVYKDFEGGHILPGDVVRKGYQWFLGKEE